MKAIRRVLWLTYGNHSSSSESRLYGSKILEALSRTSWIRSENLMEEIGLDTTSDSDQSKLENLIRPLMGYKSSNPTEVWFVTFDSIKERNRYGISRKTFDASVHKLISDVDDFLNCEYGDPMQDHKVMDQILWLAYANHSNTYRHRQNAREVIYRLMEEGECSKQELMDYVGLEYGDEAADQRFRGMMKYLRASWKDEEDALNPLHTDSHGFLVQQDMRSGDAYYSLSPKEFKRSMNVVKSSIRSLASSE